MGLPRVLVEAAFAEDAGGAALWTDLSEHLRIPEGATLAQRGRTYELDQVQSGDFSGVFRNDDGRFTPANVASPYFPNVSSSVRIRTTILWQAVAYPLFTASVNAWQAAYPTNYAARNLNQVSGTDAFKELSRLKLRSQMELETLALGPAIYYPMTEESEATAVGDIAGYDPPQDPGTVPNALLGFKGSVDESVIEFAAADPPLGGDGEQLPIFHRGSQNAGAFLTANAVPDLGGTVEGYTFSAWVATVASQGTETFVPVEAPGTASQIIRLGVKRGSADGGIQGTPFCRVINGDGTVTEAMANRKINDGRLHHIVGTAKVVSATTQTAEIYVDGVLCTDTPASAGVTFSLADPLKIRIAHGLSGGTPMWLWDGTLGHVAMFRRVLTTEEILALFKAGRDGLPAESTSDRAQRLAGYVGAPIGHADLGLSTMGSQPTAGQKLTDLLAEIANTEAGMIFPDPDGAIEIQSRGRRRDQTAARLTLDGNLGQVGDLDFTVDDTLLVNDLAYTGAGGAKARVVNQESIDRLAALSGGTGRYTGEQQFHNSAEFEAGQRALAFVTVYGEPRPRTQRIEVDLIANPELAPAALLLRLSDRLDTINLPDNAPSLHMSWLVEYLEHVISTTTWRVVVQASPYDDTRYLRLDDPLFGKLDFGNKIGW